MDPKAVDSTAAIVIIVIAVLTRTGIHQTPVVIHPTPDKITVRFHPYDLTNPTTQQDSLDPQPRGKPIKSGHKESHLAHHIIIARTEATTTDNHTTIKADDSYINTITQGINPEIESGLNMEIQVSMASLKT